MHAYYYTAFYYLTQVVLMVKQKSSLIPEFPYYYINLYTINLSYNSTFSSSYYPVTARAGKSTWKILKILSNNKTIIPNRKYCRLYYKFYIFNSGINITILL